MRRSELSKRRPQPERDDEMVRELGMPRIGWAPGKGKRATKVG